MVWGFVVAYNYRLESGSLELNWLGLGPSVWGFVVAYKYRLESGSLELNWLGLGPPAVSGVLS